MNSEEMTRQAIEILAAEYVLETLAENQRAEFESKLKVDPRLQRRVEYWQDRLGLLAEAGATLEPSAGLWAAIEAETAVLEQLPPPNLITIRQDGANWQTVGLGLQRKVLYINSQEGYQSFFLRIAPGAKLPAHAHRLTEECVVLEGEMIVGAERLYAGDYQVAEVGSVHGEIRSETGGLVFIRAQLDEALPEKPNP
jgi:quercetin dioxygenase-like cupin family protein